jgi:hypothetical protein
MRGAGQADRVLGAPVVDAPSPRRMSPAARAVLGVCFALTVGLGLWLDGVAVLAPLLAGP